MTNSNSQGNEFMTYMFKGVRTRAKYAGIVLAAWFILLAIFLVLAVVLQHPFLFAAALLGTIVYCKKKGLSLKNFARSIEASFHDWFSKL